MTELTRTGIEGLDSILGGGIVDNATVLISGNPGTGKSILGLQYIYNGVQEFDETGIYLSFEENREDIAQAAESIGFENWRELVEDDQILVYDKQELLRHNDFNDTLDLLLEEFEEMDYDRFVLDSLTMFELFFTDEQEKRTYLLKFSDILKANGLTSLLIAEQSAVFPEQDIGLENFLTDGNIYLIQTPTESGVNRYIWVAKMRKQNIETDIFPMDITDGGITVHERAAGFSMMGSGGNSPFPGE
ncbi:RecA-superfamily ATPase, KaiC/GvpD/RAD55 family [Haloplanus vescus]|uniref:RecA-superfamily ATPase, KaiC/GvpD/RAD55 family n=1 Tax=Haloplanus vescus TaxID=555874 RepID=A0A1H3WCC1_9EURY|nr:ATPase domain-containing protein [Haloplanus vescus]SDZ83992.1 RecA-superfamily ATPase, KaiC/GvpD/RAD55 family [Haloplanus vescus]